MASKWCADNPRVVHVPRRLSLTNRTLASITSLGFGHPRISTGELRRKYRRYRRLYARHALPQELHWCGPYVERMAELMDDLRLQGSA